MIYNAHLSTKIYQEEKLMDKITIDIHELRQITEKIFSSLEESGFKSLETDIDYYWQLNGEEKYNIAQVPREDLLVGKISDDLDNLKKLITDDELCATPLDLTWLSAVLRLIGEKANF